MLMALLVVRAPVATIDRLLHDTGQTHAASAFVGAIVDAPEHEHDGDHNHPSLAADHDAHDAGTSAANVTDDASSDPATLSQHHHHHHHHHDSPSVYGLPESSDLTVAWSSSPSLFGSQHDLRQGIEAVQQDRPPKPLLIYVA
ncbi:hypothetical protein [Caulobacter vibrioides]|nr:hypothetical protein [Caulobacter vibrioides]